MMLLARRACLLAAAALASLLETAGANGSPRWEDTDRALRGQSRFRGIRPFLVDVDEKPMCRPEVDTVVFFQENGCKGDLAGSTIPTSGNCFRNTRWLARRDDCWEPDTARSVLIRRGFPVGGTISVCDNPTRCHEDGYTLITLKKHPIMVLPKLIKELLFSDGQFPSSAPISYCVNTFEHTYEDLWVSVEYDPGVMETGLDGSVSRIGACEPGVSGNPQSDENTMPYDHLDSSES